MAQLALTKGKDAREYKIRSKFGCIMTFSASTQPFTATVIHCASRMPFRNDGSGNVRI